MSYEKELFDEVIYDAAEELSLSDAYDLLEWVESLEVAKSKIDEYEAKAKAFDAVLKAYDESFSREHMAGEVSNIIEKYESGELDDKK